VADHLTVAHLDFLKTYLLVRLLAERLGFVEGPPAGVLLFTLSRFLTAVCAFVGFVVALFFGKATLHDE
jgi:hypothetical protein